MYCQCLDFERFFDDFSKIGKDAYTLDDLSDIPSGVFDFLQKVVLAKDTAELKDYTDGAIEESIRTLDQTPEIIVAISNHIEDETILSDPKHLKKKMECIRLKRKRRLL